MPPQSLSLSLSMFSRKQPPSWTMEKDKYTKNRETLKTSTNLQVKYAITVVLLLSIWFLVLFFLFPFKTSDPIPNLSSNSTSAATVGCGTSTLVYIYELPPEFNIALLDDCRHLNVYTDMCPHVANSGLGQHIPDDEDDGVGGGTSWFATHQFIAEMIFHARVANHPCRTWDPSRATLFYVPFYGGLDASSKFREPNITARDAFAVKLVRFLKRQSWWRRHHGRDHFLALGRTAWDFMRTDGGTDFGANRLLNLPHVRNMSVLTVERHPWNGSNQFGIPYPSYFHPSTSKELLTWQNNMRKVHRPHLFSFIGGPRKGLEKAAIRDELIRQCTESTRCKLVKCGKGGSGKCHSPGEVIKVMKASQFCLQAPGDSFTRRSTFDAVLSGCIPVFFSKHTAYSQYAWYLRDDPSEYSVFMEDGKGGNASRSSVERVLLKIPTERVERMRETVINMIPTLTYVHPNTTNHGEFHDAVDVALAALAKHVLSELQLLLRQKLR